MTEPLSHVRDDLSWRGDVSETDFQCHDLKLVIDEEKRSSDTIKQ